MQIMRIYKLKIINSSKNNYMRYANYFVKKKNQDILNIVMYLLISM